MSMGMQFKLKLLVLKLVSIHLVLCNIRFHLKHKDVITSHAKV